MKMKFIFLPLIIFVLTSISACQQKIDDPIVKWSNPSDKIPIVFYFKKETTNDEINYFLDNVNGHQRADGRGTDLLDGMKGRFLVRNQDYVGYGIELRNNITQEQRENILKAINNSPLIYKVFENVIPNEIILDPVKAKQEKEELEKAKQDNRPKKTVGVTNSSENN